MKEKQICDKKKLYKKRFDMLIDVLQFSISTLLNSIMVTVTVIAFSLYVIFDGNLTNMLTDLLALGDEKIKDVFKVLFVPILFFIFAFRGYNFISFRKSLKEYNGMHENVMTGTCRKMPSEPIMQESMNFEERLKEVTIRKHVLIISKEKRVGMSRIKNLIDITNLNKDSTLVIAGDVWSTIGLICYGMEKRHDFKTANFSDLQTIENFKTIIIDNAIFLNNHPTLKKLVLDSFKEDTINFIMTFKNEVDSFNFFKLNDDFASNDTQKVQ